MKKLTSSLIGGVTLIALFFLATGCGTVNSTTYIKMNERFLLGDNPHRTFWVKLKNVSVSKNDIEIYRAPIAGGRHSGQTVKAGESISVKVEANTAFVILNNSAEDAAVKLVVRGDTGLSMGYKRNSEARD